MGFEVGWREHDTGYVNPPTIAWTKNGASQFRGNSTPNASMGRWYFLFVVDREWLHGKYVRWRWESIHSFGGFTTSAEIWDGEFDRGSMVDFPDGAGAISKGNGTLQILSQRSGTFAMEVRDVQVDTSGGNQEKCTIIFWITDAWNAQDGHLTFDWIQVNEGAAGADPISEEQFDDAIIVEQGGSNNDYGYIGYGQADPITLDLAASFVAQIPFLNLAAEFIVRHPDSQELLGEFEVQRSDSEELLGKFFRGADDLEELLGEFVVRRDGSQDLGASFDGQVSLNLLGEFSAGRRSQQELAAGFVVNQASRDLPGEFVSWQPGSQALLSIMNIVKQRGSADLLGEFAARRDGSQELGASFDGQVSLDLGAEFNVRRSTSENLLGAVMSRQAGSQTLLAEFIVNNADAANLLGKFTAIHSFTGTGVIIAHNPRAFFNLNVDVGTGFLATPVTGSDKRRKVIGESSHRFRIDYKADEHDYISFGWRYRYPPVPGSTRSLRSSLTVRQSSASDLGAKFEVRQDSEDLKCIFEVGVP